MVRKHQLSLNLNNFNLQEEINSAKEEKFSSFHKPVAVGTSQLLTVGTTHISKLTDEQLIKEFLSGSYCFHGVRNTIYKWFFTYILISFAGFI